MNQLWMIVKDYSQNNAIAAILEAYNMTFGAWRGISFKKKDLNKKMV